MTSGPSVTGIGVSRLLRAPYFTVWYRPLQRCRKGGSHRIPRSFSKMLQVDLRGQGRELHNTAATWNQQIVSIDAPRSGIHWRKP